MVENVLLMMALAAGAVVCFAVVTRAVGASPKECPRCHHPLPFFRMPTSVRQALWGGYTCQKCGQDIDRAGRMIT